MAKRGYLSKREREFILHHAGKTTTEEIAAKLGRKPQQVADFIAAQTGGKPDLATPKEIVARKLLRSSAEWDELRRQFGESELHYFEERYSTWMAQLGQNFVASEETQVILLLKTEILLNRNLATKQRGLVEIDRLQQIADAIYARHADPKDMTDEERADITSLTEALENMRAAQQSLTIEFVKLQDQHADLMKHLKATRDQRLRQIENAKIGFVDIVKELMREEERLKIGRQEELLRLAAVKERERLSQLHTYVNNEVDRPFLTPDSAALPPEEARP